MTAHAWHVFDPHPKGGQQAGVRPVALYCLTCGFITQLCPHGVSLLKWRAVQPPCPVPRADRYTVRELDAGGAK